MSLSDIKHVLRKLEFPASAREALVRIEQLLIGRTAPSSKQLDMAMEVISEYVFCERGGSGRRTMSLNPLQELQLIDVICDYVCECSNETTKNTVFLSLFGTDNPKRLKVLAILASMAVSASSVPVLLAVGVWLQQTGCSSPQALQLVSSIIRDHFHLNTSNQWRLKGLASSAPQFVANFIAAATDLYLQDGNERKLPPKNLLEVITSWVYCSPLLCMSGLQSACLPAGAIPMAGSTPLAGLIAWCALAPLYLHQDSEMTEAMEHIDNKMEVVSFNTRPSPPKRIKLETAEPAHVKSNNNKSLSEWELYTKLHLGVLHSLRAKRGAGPPTAVHAGRLAVLVAAVRAHAGHCQSGPGEGRLQECLDRLGQAIQVALASGCVYGSVSSLLASLHSLPENRLLKLIRMRHQSL